MFDVQPLYAPNLRHPDAPAEDFGGTSPTGSLVTSGPILESPLVTDEISILGAGTAGVDGNYLRQANGSFAGPGDRTIVKNGANWELRGSSLVLYVTPNLPFSWAVSSGASPAPSGQFI